MAYYDFLNIAFAPLLKLPTLLAIIILSFLISLLIILITKYMTNQETMKNLKYEMKSYQKQMKELKGNPAKMMEMQKKAMESNMKYMSHSLKPTLITLIPIFFIFGWMNATFAYDSIHPMQEFSVYAVFDKTAGGEAQIIVPEEITIIGNAKAEIAAGTVNKKTYEKTASWKLKGKEGEHVIEISYNEENQQHSVLITDENKYLPALKQAKGSIKSISIDYKKKVLIPIGFRDWLGWLGVYIWCSIIFTMALRKILKVY
ncbi:DUF106 domain-containing protein [Candidatus Woesearchaeota archaeon]|nr:DUF106 domain-containing protein [Candidatus Woesearchaeota archaeon]